MAKLVTCVVTDDGVIELTTALCKKAKILQILKGYVRSNFEP